MKNRDLLKLRAQNIRRNAALFSLEAFARIYLAHYIKLEPSESQIKIYRLLSEGLATRGLKLALAAPRNFGKSTIVTLAYAIYSICRNEEKFIVIISETAGQARQILENVKQELLTNEKLREDFPEIFEMSGPPKPPRWREGDIVTKNGIQIIALGVNQRIRGRRAGANRPTAVLLDDIESERSIQSAEMRENLNTWFRQSVLKVGSEKTNYIFIGNLHHHDCVLGEYVDPTRHPDWTGITLRALESLPAHMPLWEEFNCIWSGRSSFEGRVGIGAARDLYFSNKEKMDEGARSLWPERWTILELMEMWWTDPVGFESEMQNNPSNPETRVFRLENYECWNKRYETVEDLIRAVGENASYYGACDPSLGLPNGDYTAIIILLKDCSLDVSYVIVADIERLDPSQMIERIIGYARRFKFACFGVESNNFQQLLLDQLVQAAAKAKVYFSPTQVKNTGNKVARIAGLQAQLFNGQLKLSSQHTMLLKQLNEFPKSKHDDGPDCLQNAAQLASEGYTSSLTAEDVDKVVEGLTKDRNYPKYPGAQPGFWISR